MKKHSSEYIALHFWLRTTFGKANKCENTKCLGKSKNYEWAKVKGKKYEYKRENFIQLCMSCHRKYDYPKGNKGTFKKGFTPWIKGRKMPYKARPSTQGRKLSKEWIKKVSIGLKGINTWSKGRKLSKAHKKKLLIAFKNRKRNKLGQLI